MVCRKIRAAATVIELLVVTSIIALVVAVVLPAFSAGRHAAKDLECRTKMRNSVQSFATFADESGAALRGNSRQLGDRFLLEDFQESLYGIDEFWNRPDVERDRMDMSEQSLMCPAGSPHLERRSSMPCSAGAIGPQRNVSMGFNKRLERQTTVINGRPFMTTAYLTSRILQQPDVPLVFDVDGESAADRDLSPYYSAPPLNSDKVIDAYESGLYWFPSFRHRGRMNVGFVGGHVLSTSAPLEEPWWKWGIQPGA